MKTALGCCPSLWNQFVFFTVICSLAQRTNRQVTSCRGGLGVCDTGKLNPQAVALGSQLLTMALEGILPTSSVLSRVYSQAAFLVRTSTWELAGGVSEGTWFPSSIPALPVYISPERDIGSKVEGITTESRKSL